MAPLITISDELAKELRKRKSFKADTYEEVLWDMLEQGMELSDRTKAAIKKAEKDFKKGLFISQEDLIKKLGLNK